jgi:hypothetical protein
MHTALDIKYPLLVLSQQKRPDHAGVSDMDGVEKCPITASFHGTTIAVGWRTMMQTVVPAISQPPSTNLNRS